VILEILDGNIKVADNYWGQTLSFESLTSCIEYLKSVDLNIKRDTLSKYIKTGKEFHSFLCKFSDIALPVDFEEIGFIMKEYKDIWLKKIKKNKPIVIKGANFNK
jgi:hypothetical protein